MIIKSKKEIVKDEKRTRRKPHRYVFQEQPKIITNFKKKFKKKNNFNKLDKKIF